MFPLRRSLVSLLALSVAGCGGGGGGSGGGGGTYPQLPPSVSIPLVDDPAAFETAEYMHSGALSRLHASHAYAAGGSGQGITVAVVDTGIDVDHPELAANVHPDSTDIVASRGVDDVGGHGTAVAGAVAARRNGASVHGIAPEARLLAVRSDRVGSCPGACRFGQNDLANATDYATAHGARVVNYSLAASDLGNPFKDALVRAANKGTILVMAAGNRSLGSPEWPGRFAADGDLKGRGIVVGALDANDEIASFSSRAGVARNAYIVAPGVAVGTTVMGGGEGTMSGTSIASPLVSGAAALVLDLAPHLKAEQVVSLLLSTARDLGDPGVDAVYGHGMLDLEAALAPSGTVTVAAGDRVTGAGEALASSSLTLGAAFGDHPDVSHALADAVAFDALGRAYKAGLERRVAATAPASPLAAWLAPGDGVAGGETRDGVRLGFTAAETPADDAPWRGEDRAVTFTGEADLGAATRVRAALGTAPAGLGATTATGGAALPGALPHFGLVGGGGLVVDHAFGNGWRVQAGGSLDGTGDGAEGRRGVMAAIERGGDETRLRLAFGRMVEGEALGGTARGALDGLPDAATTVAGFEASAPLLPGLGLVGAFGVGLTDARRADDGLLRAASPLVSTGGGLALVARDVAVQGDGLSFGVSQPLRVETGRLTLSVPTGRDIAGNVSRERRRVDAAPEGREFDVELGYGRPLEGGARLDLKALLRLDPAHDAEAAPEFGVGLRYRVPLG
ncbi:MAG: S8 family serine peptidase [Geminicoccaceae bacterium]|nr:S8 family serine peptidase [Geminicoccaceae bacterium]